MATKNTVPSGQHDIEILGEWDHGLSEPFDALEGVDNDHALHMKDLHVKEEIQKVSHKVGECFKTNITTVPQIIKDTIRSNKQVHHQPVVERTVQNVNKESQIHALEVETQEALGISPHV